jgi:Cytochrome c554 and c-prime
MNGHPRQNGAVSALGLALCLAACGGVRVPSVSAVAPEHVGMPGPAPRGRDSETASALNATCTGCHQEIAAEWRTSLHARADRDDAYQRAFALEPLSFCQGCHAPETDAFKPVPALAADLGVGCVTCHVVNEHVLATPNATNATNATDATNDAVAPHALTRTPEFATASACATCHEFAFPDASLRNQPELMQATASEHAHSDARGVACATCHMPNVGEGTARHRSHAFPGGHDADFVKAALNVHAERCGDDRVCLVLSTEHVGHAFPTGDLFRRLEISAEAIGNDYQVVGSARRYLSRHWSEERKLSTVVRRVTHDDRPSDAPLRLELELKGPVAALPFAWRVAYQRVDHPRSEAEQDSVVDGEIEIASGTLLPLSKGAENHDHP